MLNFFKNIFKSTPKVNIESFEAIAVDMHSHLVPKIDDGSKSKEESLEIINRLYELGFKKVITTPHTMRGGYDNTTGIITDGKNDLNTFLIEEKCPITIEASSEYYLDGHFDKLINNKDLMPFGDNHILFELSFMTKPTSFETTVFNLISEGYKPILAHPERYNYLADKELTQLTKIKETGALFQLNLFSLVGAYGEVSQKIAEKLIDKEMVDFVGTDIHNRTQLKYLDQLLTNFHLSKLIAQNKLQNKNLL